jgi:SpoIID/LytB domain protein
MKALAFVLALGAGVAAGRGSAGVAAGRGSEVGVAGRGSEAGRASRGSRGSEVGVADRGSEVGVEALARRDQKTENRESRTAAAKSRAERPFTVTVGLAKPGGGYTLVEMPLDVYVARVLAGEALRDSQPAALEALAITVRTFAAGNRGRHRAEGFDLCDQTHCQVLRPPIPATERAASATTGQTLVLRDGTPATVYYSASCGGHTAIPSEVWPGHDDPPYLPGKVDEACAGAPAWSAELHETDLLRALRGAGFRGELRGVRIASRNDSGRVAELRLDGLRPDSISGQDLRVAVGRTLGWQYIKSASFELQKRGSAYRFAGHGSGHGVGLCVIGSAKLAERGVTARAILARYFPGLIISDTASPRRTDSVGSGVGGPFRSQPGKSTSDPSDPSRPRTDAPTSDPNPAAPTSDPKVARPFAPLLRPGMPDLAGVLISLPDDDEGERPTIERQALRARDELARTLGVAAPPRLRLRFHPTTDAFEQATGRAWFTSATIVDGEMHLLPLATLRARGVLERTIRHELVHLMTDSVLAARPRWVREGAAVYFAGEQPRPVPQQRPAFRPPPKASCPADVELQQPVSVGALANAYARARACFARELQSGKSWREIR